MKLLIATRALVLGVFLVPSGLLHAFCWPMLMDTWTVCTEGSYGGGQQCTTYYEWNIICEGGGSGDPGGGSGDPGGGGSNPPPPPPPSGCPEVIITNLESIQGSTLSGYGRLVGSVSVYPASAQIELAAQGPGLSQAGYGAGPFDFSGSLDQLSLGDNSFTVTASGPAACGGYSNSAMGIISRTRFRAIAWAGASPYSLSVWDPNLVRNRTLYMNGSISGFELFDHYASSPTGNGNDIPYTRTVSSTAVVTLSTLPDVALVGASVDHEYTGYAYYANPMSEDYGGISNGIPFSLQAAYWFGAQPAEGISTLKNLIVDFLGSVSVSTPAPGGLGPPARAVADFSTQAPF